MNNGYSICFNEWTLDKDIKNELSLLLIISSLTAEKGYCYASNKYLGELFDIDESMVSKKIKKLERKGYIEVEYTKIGNVVSSRIIRLSKMTTAIVKNDKENNISINNKENNISKDILQKKVKNFTPPTLEEVQDYINQKQLNVNAKQFYEYFEVGNWKDSKGNQVKNWKQKLLTWEKFNSNKSTNTKKESLNEMFDRMKKEGKLNARR